MGDEKVIPIAYTKISIDQESGGVFTSCSFPALTLSHESIDVFTGEGKGEKLYTNSIMTFGDVTLTRGVTDNKALHDWAFDFARAGPDRTGQAGDARRVRPERQSSDDLEPHRRVHQEL